MYCRKDARKYASQQNGDFYALHIRRGDLQFKEVKIGARQMVKNLRFLNGTSIIPAGALVYLSTDDPDGLCIGVCELSSQSQSNIHLTIPHLTIHGAND